MSTKIRPASIDDAAVMCHVCLLTADAGESAELLHDYPELPGLVWAVPYLTLPTTWAFVLEEETTGEIVRYIVGSRDTRAYENYAADFLWPRLARAYPVSSRLTKSGDLFYTRLLQAMRVLPESTLAFAQAHFHINILPSHQKQGWGQKLVDTAFGHLQSEGVDGVWLVVNPKNHSARRFYEDKLGFKRIAIDGLLPNHLGSVFD
ncbi:acyl-CoA N-acyltransferase [Roridomyces roridus]|uniref:Acyl-CoA N-acyltransferase n=1 Tax=Roridomyces roridus TaxID=1738132 RepID=A0AAD7BTQ2_9AGAR|nr:acyl-CoA N-acyltransferase [Roridomyces roridus]